MQLPLIPTAVLAFMSLMVTVLAVPALLRLPEYNREQLLILMGVGIIFIACTFCIYGILYFYYTTYVTEVELRQRSIRLVLLFMSLVINTWFLAIIFFKKGIGKLWNS